MTIVSVGRQGQEIGDYHLDGIREGLASGYFLPDDFGWYEGLSEWLPLSVIVERLGSLPPPFPILPVAPPPFILPPPVSRKIKQKLKPKKGEVTYILAGAKERQKNSKTGRPHSWEDDPATDKQIAFLKVLGIGRIPKKFTKGEASKEIGRRVEGKPAQSILSPKQFACLSYYGFDLLKLSYDEAMVLLERVHESPESFKVPEPWETAKYRLYPKLYSDPNRKKPRGCLTLILVTIICGGAIVFLLLR